MPVTLHIGCLNHCIHFLFTQIFSEFFHNVFKLRCTYEPIAILIEKLKRFLEALLCISLVEFIGHERNKLINFDLPISVLVDAFHNVLELCLCGVESERFHHYADFFNGYSAISIFVKESKSVSKFFDLVWSKFVLVFCLSKHI